MKQTSSFYALTAALALGASASAQAQLADAVPGNLVQNGSLAFSADGVPLPSDGLYYAGANPFTLSGWTFVNSATSAEYWVSFGNQASPDGGQYLGVQDLANYAPRINVAGISQSVSGLEIGATYDLSFYSMSNHDGSAEQLWNVSFGGSSLDGTATHPNADDTGTWTLNTASFTATSAVQALTFMAQYLPGSVPEMLDLDGVVLTRNQSTVPAVPEPSTWALLLAGLAATGWAGRRQAMGD